MQGIYGSDWRADVARAGGGTLLEHSIHDLDLLDWIAGPITDVSARTASFHGIDGIEDLAVVVLGGADGAASTLTSVWHDVLARPSMRHVEVLCERAHYVLAGDVDGPVRWTVQAPPASGASGASGAEGAPASPGSPAEFDELHGEDAVAGKELRALVAGLGLVARNPDVAFVEAVAAGRAASPTLADALPAHRLAEAAYRSANAAGGLGMGPVAPVPAR